VVDNGASAPAPVTTTSASEKTTAPTSAPEQTTKPTKIEEVYEIGKELGRGGFSIVKRKEQEDW